MDLLQARLAGLVDTDVAGLTDGQVRELLPQLLVATNQLHTVLASLVASFDTRDLSTADGYRSVRGWLGAFGRLSHGAATTVLAKGRLLLQLPALAAAAKRGEVSAEHLGKVAHLAEQVGVGGVQQADEILATACTSLAPADLERLCERIRAHVDPDGPEPDPEADFERRSLVLSGNGRMLLLRGRLDAEAGAALRAALDALMSPPAVEDFRTAAQRRADALAELARQALNQGQLPTVNGIRPHLGILITPTTLLHDHHLTPQPQHTRANPTEPHHGQPDPNQHQPDKDHYDEDQRDHVDPDIKPAEREPDEREPADGEDAGRGDNEHDREPDEAEAEHADAQPEHSPSEHREAEQEQANHGDPRQDRAGRDRAQREGGEAGFAASEASARAQALMNAIPPAPQPAWLEWFGEVPAALAQRLACDANIWRVVLDPSSGLPLDVGRSMRLVPHWMRKALHARDRGCRWPGCTTPSAWTDAHHLDPWYLGGRTSIDSLLQLCRWHHVRVHEGGWRIELNRRTGELGVYRPDGRPYEIPPSQPWLGPTTRRGDPPTPTAAPPTRAAA